MEEGGIKDGQKIRTSFMDGPREEGQKKMRAWEVRALKSGRVYCWPGSSGHCSAILKELIPVLYTVG